MRTPPAIESYGPGGFRVGGIWRPGSLLILGDEPLRWAPTSLAELDLAALEPILAAGPSVSEFVLLGTGADQALPPRAIREALRAAGIGLEFMSTPRAAAAWAPLMSDGRRVAAALIAL